MSKEKKELKIVEVEVLTSKKGNKYLKGYFAPLEKNLIINLVSKETYKRIPLDDLRGKIKASYDGDDLIGKFKVSYSGYVLNETQEFLTLFKVELLWH